jgi:alpha-tubulin suppressor-like RCC1 family protein
VSEGKDDLMRKHPSFKRLGAALVAVTALASGAASSAQAQAAYHFKAMSSGSANTCGIKADDTLLCWGDNGYGQTDVPSGTFKAVEVGTASTHICAIRSDDTLVCWGDPENGATNAPSGTFKGVTNGHAHSCAIRSDDTLTCWGVEENQDVGQTAAPLGTFTAVNAGVYHTCAIRSDDSLVCWGYNASGQADPPAGSFKALDAGNYHNCAVRADDSLACWGFSDFGQTSPPAGSFKAAAGGYGHTCAISSDDSLACWGDYRVGQLNAPSGSFKAVSAGDFSACALRLDGTVACWGENNAGQGTVPTPPSVDADGDGVEDSIDAGVGQFDDGAGTSGTITDRAGLEVTIADEAAPDGVKVTVGPGIGKVTLSVCGGFTLKVAAGSEVVVTCGSVKVEVLQGSAEVVLGGGLTVISVPSGVTAKVSQNPNGSYTTENLGGGSLTVTIDGVQTTIAAGQTKSVTALDFQGFTSPVDNPTVLNVVKAGQAVPFKWRLLRPDGSPYTGLTAASMTVASLTCSLGATPDQLEEVAPGDSGLLNLGNGYYQLNWKSPKNYADSCKVLRLNLGEGVTRDAYFKFTR